MPTLGVTHEVASRMIPEDGLLVSMAEHFDQFILDWQMKHPSVWRDRLPVGQFPLFSGYSQKSYIFRGTLGPQAGLSEWSAIEPSSKAGEGSDRCSYNPSTYSWGMDAIDFSGLQTSWRSPVFCVNDLKFQDKAQQQLAMIIKAGAAITDQVKETFNRETYVRTAANNGKFVAMVEGGGVSYIDDPLTRVSYDPFVKDGDGDTYITFDATLLPSLSTLNWTHLDLIKQYLSDMCPEAAQGNDSGMPVFGLLLDLTDFEHFVLADSDLREDFRRAIPARLIDGFNMGFRTYRGYMIMHDLRQMRFKISTITAGGLATAKRVLPRRSTRAGIIGTIPETNPEYVTAELGTAVVFLKDVVQILIPSPVNTLGSGMSFGPAPDFNGNWAWVNNKSDTNPLGEVGYFFSRYEYFVKMLEYAQNATVLLYRRCPHAIKTSCAIDTQTRAKATAVALAKAPVEADVDATARSVVLQLAAPLAAGVGAAVSINADDDDNFTAYIAEDSNAPTYKFVWLNGATNAPTGNAAAMVGEINDITKVTVIVL